MNLRFNRRSIAVHCAGYVSLYAFFLEAIGKLSGDEGFEIHLLYFRIRSRFHFSTAHGVTSAR
jgi:hypothetical protein